MNARDLEKHGLAICALVTSTGTYSGPLLMLHESIEEVLNEDEFGKVVMSLCSKKLATLRGGIFTLTEEGIRAGKNFGAGMALHKATKKQGKIQEGLN